MSQGSGKRIELRGSRKEMLDAIVSNSGGEEFFIKTKPSVKVFALLLDATKAKRVCMNSGIAKTVPENVMDSLRRSISVDIVEGKRGRPKKFREEEFLRVLKAAGSERERLAELGMSRRTYYYWKKRLNGNKH